MTQFKITFMITHVGCLGGVDLRS